MGSGNNCVISHSESMLRQNVVINTGHKAKFTCKEHTLIGLLNCQNACQGLFLLWNVYLIPMQDWPKES